jgi:hypothetical protein
MLPVGLEPTISLLEWAKTVHALARPHGHCGWHGLLGCAKIPRLSEQLNYPVIEFHRLVSLET